MSRANFGMATWKNFSLMKINHAQYSVRQRKLRLGKKSDIIHCIEDKISTEDRNPLSDVALDGAAIVNMLKPRKTFRDYYQRCFSSIRKITIGQGPKI